MAHDDDCWWKHHPDALLGSSGEHDDYQRWTGSRQYRIELAAILIAGRHGAEGVKPCGDDYRAAALIVDALTP